MSSRTHPGGPVAGPSGPHLAGRGGPHLRRRPLRGLAALGLTLLALVTFAATALGQDAAAAAPAATPTCGAAPSGSSKTFVTQGTSPQTFKVPTGVTALQVDVAGGHGGKDNRTADGGPAGLVTGLVQVTPGECLLVYVAQRGSGSSGGWGWGDGGSHGTAGGSALNDASSGAAGGGSSAIVRGSTPLVVAGGGGGGGGDDGNTGDYGGPGGAGAGTGQPGRGTYHGPTCGGCSGSSHGGRGHSGNNTDENAGGGGGGGGASTTRGGGGGGEADGGGAGGGGGASLAGPGSYVQLLTSPRACPYRETPSTCNGQVTLDWAPTKITFSGLPHEAQPLTRFKFPFYVTVTAGTARLPGVAVRLTLPSTGASGYFGDPARHVTSETKVTDAYGQVTSDDITANAIPGSWTATATVAGAGAPGRVGLVTELPNSRTSLESSVNPSYAGAPVTFTAHVSVPAPATPTGLVRFTADGKPIGQAVKLRADGSATADPVTLTAGDHTVQATFDGGPNRFGTSSAELTQTVRKIPTATTVTVAPSPSQSGNAVALTARVSGLPGTPGTPSGTVAFQVDGHAVGEAPVGADGTASLPGVSIDGVGTHVIVAAYGGAAAFVPSQGSATQGVGPDATTTTLTLSPDPSVYGQTVNARATVSGTGPSAPQGTVTFDHDGHQYCRRTLAAADASSATAQCDIVGPLAPGAHAVVVTYQPSGDTTAPSQATVTGQVVAARTTTSVTALTRDAVYGQSVRLRALVTPIAPGFGNPAGSVQFTVDDRPYGAPVTLAADGIADSPATAAPLDAGPHTFGATYRQGPGRRFEASSGSGALRVAPVATAISVASGQNPSPLGGPVTFATTVASALTGAPAPTGAVLFTAGATRLSAAPVPLTGGLATVTTAALGLGTSRITVSYGGDANHLPSRGALAQTVVARGTPTPPPTTPVAPPPSSGPPGPPHLPPSQGTPVHPRITRVSLTRARFTLARPRRGRRTPTGTTLRYTLSARATVTIRIAQRLPGRRHGRRCVAPSHRLRHAARCTRLRTRLTLIRRNQAHGRRTITLTAALRRRRLPPGSYQVAVGVPSSSAAGAPARRFVIVAGSRARSVQRRVEKRA